MIRVARFSDLDLLVDWGAEFYHQTEWSSKPLDKSGLRDWISSHLRRSDRVVFMSDDGAIGAALSEQSPICPGLFADETFWFARGSGVKLLLTLENWSRSRGAILRMTTLESSPPAANRLLERRGYVKRQTLWEGPE